MDAKEIAQLIASSTAAGVSAIKAVADLLTAGRSVIIEVDNNTDLTLVKTADHHESGGFAVLPSLSVGPHSTQVFGSQSKGGAVAAGTVGSVTYTAEGLEMLVGWNNPFTGDNKTNVGPDNSGLGGPDAKRFLAIHQTGVGNQQAHMRFMLFVHPPYSAREEFRDRGDLSQGLFKILGVKPGSGLRGELPNSTNIDAT